MPIFQKDRIYSLIVGKDDDAVEINNLEIKFKVTKTSSNKDKKNEAYIEIYNLTEERRNKLEEDYVQVAFAVGRPQTGLIPLFQGQVTNITSSKLNNFLTKRQGTDLVTRLDVDELYTQLNMDAITGIVPAGRTVRSVVEAAVRNIPEVTRQEMSGSAIETQLPSGYPMAGTPRQILDKLSRDYDLEWQIDGGVLYVTDVGGALEENRNTVFSIGQFSGLIERPEYINEEAKRLRRQNKGKKPKSRVKQNSIKMSILLNPAITAGNIIHLDFGELTGFYKVDEVIHVGDFRGDEWYSKLICTERID